MNFGSETGADGSYTFGSLLAGSYAISETPPTGFQGLAYVSSTAAVGQVNGGPSGTDGTAGTTAISSVTLKSGDVGTIYDFMNVYQSINLPPG